ncbi:MAG TPA: hypothetical protein VFC17_05125 [Candidatus Limnocylindrales bacterium]|nr:hypothetical protein [Candidatus Limnocylindrales bacterium]
MVTVANLASPNSYDTTGLLYPKARHLSHASKIVGDDRWYAFGFDKPSDPSTPEVPANLIVVAGAPGRKNMSRDIGALLPNDNPLTRDVGAITRDVEDLTADGDGLTFNIGALTFDVGALIFDIGGLTFDVFSLKSSGNGLFYSTLRRNQHN